MLDEALRNARATLLSQRSSTGSFRGELSSSALSTATASVALALAARGTPKNPEVATLAVRARAWLAAHQNHDGGFGDTPDSPTNVSTTALAWSALALDPMPSDETRAAIHRAEAWLATTCGGLSPDHLASTIRDRYGKDRTFSAPILFTCAITGRLGKDGWRHVPRLPFELAACPHQWFRWLSLRMVSYALPALIAIGQASHHHRPSRNPVFRSLRRLAQRRTLRILEDIQPESGGYLEAVPLTSFVAMGLLSMGLHDHPVVQNGLSFLRRTMRDDGSWPIDTNLDTWTTTLAVNALGTGGAFLDEDGSTRRWLLDQQYRTVHPYTWADPGGFAWTDLPGGVPDADDTAGALLALHHLAPNDERVKQAADAGITWLVGLRNRDGGVPTFCPGWGKLPFDRSCPDITAHALRAWTAWSCADPDKAPTRSRVIQQAVRYTLRNQQDDGSWVPLWFGNQAAPNEENPLYGTTRVLRAIAEVVLEENDVPWTAAGTKAIRWVLATQGPDGGWGGAADVPPSIEETALAVEALAAWGMLRGKEPGLRDAVDRGASWLAIHTQAGTQFPPAPIGLYFAKLWYSENLYPVTFTVAALELASRLLAQGSTSCPPKN